MWFRITSGAVRRMRQETPRARGERLTDALLACEPLLGRLGPDINRFQALVAE